MPQFPVTLKNKRGESRTAHDQASLVRYQFDGFKAPKNAAVEAFDPSKHSVGDVQAYLAGDISAAERQRVVAAETSGRNRPSIVNPS